VEKLPVELRWYIEQQIRSVIASNHAEHRSTPQAEIDKITEESKKLYDDGRALMESIGKEDLERCRRFFAVKFEYGSDALTRRFIMKKDVIVPQYVTLYERMRIVRAAIL